MFTAMLALGAAAAIGGVVSSVVSSNSQKKINQQNEQRVQTENEITRSREDNAVQRRVADLRLAGLSPTLAAGSAAASSAGQVYQQNNNPIGDIAKAAGYAPETMMNALSAASSIQAQQQSISQSRAQEALLAEQLAGQRHQNQLDMLYGAEQLKDKHMLSQAQYNSLVASTKGNVLNNAIIEKFGLDKARFELNSIQNRYEMDKYDFDKYKSLGLPTGGAVSDLGRLAQDAAFGLQNRRFSVGRNQYPNSVYAGFSGGSSRAW